MYGTLLRYKREVITATTSPQIEIHFFLLGELSCGIDQVPSKTQCSTCDTCPAGEVPNSDKTSCIACPLSQIEVSGQCQNCPAGQAPEDDRISCYVEIDCPDDCTSPDQGDCDKRTGTCNCKSGFFCSNCGKLIIRNYFIPTVPVLIEETLEM